MATPEDQKKPPPPAPAAPAVVRKLRFDAGHAGVRRPCYLAVRDRPDQRS
jgi:hypothetical protein